MKNNDDTLEIYRLIVSNDEVEYEAKDSIITYLLQRSSQYANKLGKMKLVIKEMEYHIDSTSEDHIFVFYCERDFR